MAHLIRLRALLGLLGLAAVAAPPPVMAPSPVTTTLPVSVGPPVGVALPAAGPSLNQAGAPAAFRWPLDGVPRVVRRFDPPAQPWLPGHRGVDLASTPGGIVRAAGGGAVLFAGRIAGRGVVSISHPSGLRTTYEPVEPRVVAGQRLDAGQSLGVLAAGHPGCPVAACLHWGLRRGEEYLDPLALLGLNRVRLLPARSASRAGNRGTRRSYPSKRVVDPAREP